MASRGNGQADDGGSLSERVSSLLFKKVDDAAEAVAHLETKWSRSEMVKRIVKYIWKAASAEALQKHAYERLTEELIQSFIHAYHASCGDKGWFFKIDLTPVFTSIIMEMLRSSRRSRGVTHAKVQAKVVDVYNEKLDFLYLQNAIWAAVETSFKNSQVQAKIYNSLMKTYNAAFQDTQMDSRPLEPVVRMEDFIRRWMDSSMARAWSACESAHGSPTSITQVGVTKLFQNLVAPFGDDDEFSCVPAALTQEIGPPPRTWAFIGKATKIMFDRWARESMGGGGSKNKRRKKGGGGGDEAVDPAPASPSEEELVEAKPDEDSDDPAAQEEDQVDGLVFDVCGESLEDDRGHPVCTLAEDCIGAPEERLIQHILDGRSGDIYCARCWEHFKQDNPALEGVEVSQEELGMCI